MMRHVIVKCLLEPIEAHAGNLHSAHAKTTVKGASITALHLQAFRG
jgi:hypothetical protein